MKFIKGIIFLVLMWYSAFSTTICVIAEHTTPQGGEVFLTYNPDWELHSLNTYAAYCSYDESGDLWLINKTGAVTVFNGSSFEMRGSVPGTICDISAHDKVIVSTSLGMYKYIDNGDWNRINYVTYARSIESYCDEDSEIYCLIGDYFVLCLELDFNNYYYYPQLPGASHDITYSYSNSCPQVICNSGAERELFYYSGSWWGDGHPGDLKRVDTFTGVTAKIKERGPVTKIMYDLGVVVLTPIRFVDVAVFDFGPQ